MLKNRALVTCLKYYLNFKQECVTTDSVCSPAETVKSGILQESVVVPLFPVFIIDIANVIPGTIRLF